jgi:hypothetical protein
LEYQARSARVAFERAKFGDSPPSSLPPGFVKKITGPRAWSGLDLGKDRLAKFTIQLRDTDIAEIQDALAHFKGLPGDNQPEHVTTELFPLPLLGPRLVEISKELHEGAGITVLKGLEPGQYSQWDNVVLFAGITAYLGDRRGCQDRYGNMLSEWKTASDLIGNLISTRHQLTKFPSEAHLVDMGFKYGCNNKLNPTFTPNALVSSLLDIFFLCPFFLHNIKSYGANCEYGLAVPQRCL